MILICLKEEKKAQETIQRKKRKGFFKVYSQCINFSINRPPDLKTFGQFLMIYRLYFLNKTNDTAISVNQIYESEVCYSFYGYCSTAQAKIPNHKIV